MHIECLSTMDCSVLPADYVYHLLHRIMYMAGHEAEEGTAEHECPIWKHIDQWPNEAKPTEHNNSDRS